MTPSQKCSELILDALKRGLGDVGMLSALASDYSELCRKLNSRLDQLREVLDRGDERQALLMAEGFPPVMDEAQALCFPKVNQWRELCAANGLPPLPEIRTSVIQQLNVIYAKGITSSHAIYKEFRTAILERDDDRAFALSRTIEKLNPADVNARTERERLEKKVFGNRLEILSEALKSDDEERVLRALAALETLDLPKREALAPAVTQAQNVRQAAEARQARGRVSRYVEEIGSGHGAGEWLRVRELIARCDALLREHALSLSPDELDIVTRGREYVAKRQEAVFQKMQFQQALNELLTHSEIVESKTQARGTLAVPELHQLLAELSRFWQSVEAFSMEVEPEVVQKVSRQVETLRTEIARQQKRRVALAAGSLVTFVVLASLAGWYLLGLFHATEAAAALRAAVAARHVGGSERIVSESEKEGLSRFSSSLVSAIEEAKAFQGASRESIAMVEQHLLAFESLAGASGFADADPIAVNAQFNALQKEAEALPEESQTPFKARMQKSSELLASWLEKEAEKMRAVLADNLNGYDENVKDALEKGQSLKDFRKVLEAARQDVDLWRKATEISHPAFELPPDLSARFEAITQRLNYLKSGLDVCDSAIGEMGKALNAEEFKAGLKKLADSDLTFVADVEVARLAMSAQPTADEIIGPLIFPDDPIAWTACKNGGEAMGLHPKNLLPKEDAAYDKLLNDPNSDKIFQANLRGRPNRLIFTANQALSNSSTPGGIQFYSGKIYDPVFDGNVIRFTTRSLSSESFDDREKATSATDVKLSGFSTIYAAMSPRTFMMDSGDIAHSVWELLDRATATGGKSPSYMAFVLQQIEELISVRPYAWSLHFSPGARSLLASFKEKLGGERILSGAWMIPEKREVLEKRLGTTFVSPTSFKKEAIFYQALTTGVKIMGLEFVGYVGIDGIPILAPRLSPPESLFGLNGTMGDHSPARIFEREIDASSYRSLGKPLPFTPLFRFAGDRKVVLQNARKVSLIGEAEHPLIPPLFSGLSPIP